MKKIIVFLFLLIPTFVFATIDQNLYYGLTRNNNVTELQQYLVGKGFLSVQPTGNFFSLTLNAVKKYQMSKNIPATGYVGPLTRQAINTDLLFSSNTKPTDKTASIPTPLTGSLNLLQNTSYPSQSVIAPQSKLKLADFSLTNNTTEAINLKTIEVDLATDSNLYITNLYVANLYLAYGDNKTTILNTVAHSNYWSINFQLPIGQTIDLSVYGDVNSSIPLNSTINSSVLVTGITAVSGVTINTNSNAVLSGQNITFGAGSLAVGADGSTPPSRMVAANQRVVAGKFQFTATNDFYTISELKFIVPNPLTTSIILDAVLSDTATGTLLTPNPISALHSGDNYVFDFNVNIPVSINSSRSLTLYYDLRSDVNFYSTNTNVAPILAYIKATNSKGTLMDGAATNYDNIAYYNGIALPVGGITFNNIYVFKSIPTFAVGSSSASAADGSNINLYTFSIGADPKGDISVKQLMFTVTITDPNNKYPYLNNFSFLKGNTYYNNSVIIGKDVNNLNVSLINSGIGVGTNQIVLTFNTEETIPAGTTQTYTLKAVVNNFVSSTELGAASISVSMLSDTAQSNSGSYLRMIFTKIYGLSLNPTNMSFGIYNLLWSDKSSVSFPPHSYENGFSTGDWYNGFGVLNFPLPSQIITAQ